MKIAVISDIHGNLPALKAVLADAEKQGVAEYIFAGDYCLSGPFPDDCITTIRRIKNKHIIRGNEESYLENLIGKDQCSWTDGQMQISYWCFRNISPDNLRYLMDLPYTLEFIRNGVRIHVSHASSGWIGSCESGTCGPVALAEKYACSAVTPESLSCDIRSFWDQDTGFRDRLSELEEGIYLFGHTHVQWSYKAHNRNTWLINPGSCGLPLDGIQNTVPYTVIDIAENGTVMIEEIRIHLEKPQYVELLKTTTQFTEANIWSRVILRELLTARENMTFFLQHAEQYARAIGDSRRPYVLDTWEKAYTDWIAEVGRIIIPVDQSNLYQAAEIHSVSWQDSHRSFCTADFIALHTPEHQLEYLAEKIRQGSKVYMLLDDEPVGIVSLTGSLIEDLYIIPDRQNKGYGTALLEYAVSLCPDTPTLWILENNVNAKRLYCRKGFLETGNRNNITEGLDEIEFALINRQEEK